MPPKSTVWAYFDKDTKKCRLCGKVVLNTGNTTNLWNHLKNYHPGIATNKPATNVRLTAEESVDDPEPTHNAASGSVSSATATSTTSRKRSAPPEIGAKRKQSSTTIKSAFAWSSSHESGGDRANDLNDAVLYMVVKDKLPLCTTENEGFLHFSKKAVPLWKPPSRGKLTTEMEKKYQSLHDVVKEQISGLPSVCLTTDGWTDRHTNSSYLGVTVHFLHDLMASAVVGLMPLSESHTGVYLSEKLEEFCNKWAITKDKVSVIVTDNAENMKPAAKTIFGSDRHIPCFDHTLNLIPKSALGTFKNASGEQEEKVSGLPGLMKKIRDIVTLSHTSNNFADELKRIQLVVYQKTEGTVLRLAQDVETRWNSTYQMTSRFIDMADIVATAALRFPNVKMLTAQEINTVRAVNKLLLPFNQATLDMSSESVVTGSKAIPMARMLSQKISACEVPPDDMIASKLKIYVQSELYRRFDNLELVIPLAVATILDPRFKRLHFTSPIAVANTLSFLTREFKKLVEEENTRGSTSSVNAVVSQDDLTPSPTVGEDLWSNHDAEVSRAIQAPVEDYAGGLPVELRQYLNRPVVPRSANPFEVWQNMRFEYPHLYRMSRRFLPILAASTPSERLFSLVGLTATDLRSRLTPQHLSQLTFLSTVSDKLWQASK